MALQNELCSALASLARALRAPLVLRPLARERASRPQLTPALLTRGIARARGRLELTEVAPLEARERARDDVRDAARGRSGRPGQRDWIPPRMGAFLH